MIHHFMGNPQQSESHLDRAYAWLTPERHARLREATGLDVLGIVLALSALNRWFLGRPEAALARSRAAVVAARAAEGKVGQAVATVLGASLLFYLRIDQAAMAELSEESHRVCVEHGIRPWRTFAEVMLGRLMVMRGENAAGIERIQRAIAGWQAAGIAMGIGAWVVVLADSCLAAARLRALGRDAVRDSFLRSGLEAIDAPFGPPKVSCGECYEAEVHRMRGGELLRARDSLAAAGEALACFQRALRLGREKGALAWELRAAMSLVHLRERQGKAHAAELAEARACLQDVYAQFTEGLAFPDLQDAATLIGNDPRQKIRASL